MCMECRQYPCHPRCPNASESVPVLERSSCFEGIYEGDTYFESEGGPICTECLSEMSAKEYLDFIGETFCKAEKEEPE